MPYLVDGDNLLGTWPGRPRDDGERARLAHELARFARRRGKRVVLVFDGYAPAGTAPQGNVVYAGKHRSADDVILALLGEQLDRRGWIVVTSDRALADRSRHLEAQTERADIFRKRLDAGAGAEKPEREDDVAAWLERFEPR